MASPHTDGSTSAKRAATPAERLAAAIAELAPKTVTILGDEPALTTALLLHGQTVEPHTRSPITSELVVVAAGAGRVDALAPLGPEVVHVLAWRADDGSLGEVVATAATRGYFRSANQIDVDGVSCVLLDARERTLAQLVAQYEMLLVHQPDLAAQVRDLRHELLTSRDHAIGAEAEIAHLRNLRHDQELRIEEIYDSTSWRVGLRIVSPLGKVKRALGR